MYQKVCTERASETVAYRVDHLLAKVVSLKKKSLTVLCELELVLDFCTDVLHLGGTGSFIRQAHTVHILCPILF